MHKKIYLIIIHILALIGLFFIAAYIAILLGFTKTKGIIDPLNRRLDQGANPETQQQAINWIETEEYQSFKKSIPKDEARINAAAQAADIDARLIMSALLSEQMRLYTDASRESFKKFFQPLSILGIQSQYSWGVMGLKRETAIQIENNLKDKTSPFYLGEKYENLLDFATEDIEKERFERLINEDDQYYTYLYSGLYMQQIMKQWEDAGFSLDNKPEIVATLFNIGFIHSKPNADPKAGGAQITVGGKTYSFGRLAYEFYFSDELPQF